MSHYRSVQKVRPQKQQMLATVVFHAIGSSPSQELDMSLDTDLLGYVSQNQAAALNLKVSVTDKFETKDKTYK